MLDPDAKVAAMVCPGCTRALAAVVMRVAVWAHATAAWSEAMVWPVRVCGEVGRKGKVGQGESRRR